MPQADIEINGTAASDEDLPINTLVQLSNNDVGDESTYLWEIVSQPTGPVDALSATNIEGPTLTPLKEGTYLLQLTVDQGLPTEQVDRKLFRIRVIKTFVGLIAAEETVEADPTEGWKTRQNDTLRRYGDLAVGGIVIACQSNEARSVGD